MALPLPNLDDRRWADLVEEGRALIPLHAPGWTDHNVHDPGMTLIDLLAWVTEADLYGINRIRDSHLRKFLALVGLRPRGPAPAHTVASFHRRAASPGGGATPIRIPASTDIEGVLEPGAGPDSDGTGGSGSTAPDGRRQTRVRFRTVRPLDIQPARVVSLQLRTPSGFLDLTARWERGEDVELFGPAPCPGDALYLGLDAPLAPGSELSLYLRLAPDEKGESRSGDEERRRLLDEAEASALRCPPRSECGEERFDKADPPEEGGSAGDRSSPTDGGAHPSRRRTLRDRFLHHSARLAWELLEPTGSWRPVERVADETRSLSLNGHLALRVPDGNGMAIMRLGEADTELHYVRCRLERGFFDAPPVGRLVANAVRAIQAIPTRSTWEVPPATPSPPALEAGAEVGLDLAFDPDPARLPPRAGARLRALSVPPDPGAGQPALRVLRYTPPDVDVPGFLDVEAEWLGQAAGTPDERFELRRRVVLPDTLRVFTINGSEWHEWRRRDDPFGSSRGDRHFLLERSEGAVVFGDGERGRTPPRGADVLAVYDTTLGEKGNLSPSFMDAVSDSLHNRALLADLEDVRLAVRVSGPLPSRGGRDAESLESALGRAFLAREERTRAVTLEDCEALALDTPGTRIARASAWGDVHPDYPCFSAPGVITVVIVPYLPVERPRPSAGLLRQVQEYLDLRSVIGTRIVVAGPTYRCLTVRASVRARPRADAGAIPARTSAALDAFFHPLRGGPEGDGWPLGRDVFRSEVLQVLDEVPGVDHVVALELVPDCGEPSCGNLCLGPTDLIATAQHRIEVVP